MVKNFAQNWLDIQCQAIDGLHTALFLLYDPDKQNLNPVTQWPIESKAALELMAIAQVAAKTQDQVVNAGIKDPATGTSAFDYLALPIFADKQLLGVLAAKTSHHAEAEQQKILTALSIGNKWLALPQIDQDPFYMTVVKLAVACLEQDSVNQACNALISAFSQEFACDRVSVGMVNQGHAQVIALSNSSKFDDKTNLLRLLSAAMDEALDQDQALVYPPSNPVDTLITYAHADLASKFGSGAICTIPMVHDGETVAVVTLERSSQQAFAQKTINMCRQTLALLAPFLSLKQRDELPLAGKLGHSLKKSWDGSISFRHIGLKLAGLASMIFLVGAALIDGDFRIHADAVLEGRIQRTISAPMNGFIKSAKTRAGDTVLKDEVVATLEDSDLKLEQVKLSGQQQQLQREYREAMAKRDLVQIRVFNSQLGQIDAQIKMNAEQLQRTVIQAPFDGVVIEGDLSQSLGAPVERGDSLFKIAPLDGYRVILKINERYISYIQAAQTGILKLSGLPDQQFPLRIEKITQVASADDHSNIFRVEASLLDKPKLLRPGMEGVGKIEVGQKKWLWIWSYDLLSWLRLWVWSWWP